ncbi:MAG TPA: cation:proton antiporter [Longimicrobiales bacterium]|nr:cation:proton antiporter [Longimicrobiales bacterium]
MRRALILILLLFGMQLILPLGRDVPGSGALLTLGFLILAAYTVGEIVATWGFPKLLGYLVAGIIFGPSMLGTVTPGSVVKLQPINQLAVALIAFVAGAELKWSDLKRDGTTYARILGVEMPLTFVMLVGAIFLLRPLIPVLSTAGVTETIVFGMLLAAIGIAHSPAATLGLVKETGARGPVAHHTLGVVLLSDLFLIVFFSVVVSAARLILPPTGAEEPPSLALAVWEISGALVVGSALGGVVALYMRFIQRELLLFSVIIALLGVELARVAHVELLLTLLTAGFITENIAKTSGDALVHAVERAAAPIFVVFFALSGASINIAELRSLYAVVIPLVIVRILAIWLGTMVAARRSKFARPVADRIWLGLVAQMGVAIGLATVIAGVYPRLGPAVQTLAMALIAINQLIGPVFFKRALSLSGELPRPSLDERVTPRDLPETASR